VGAGVVSGTESVVVLTNQLYALLQTEQDPSTAQLTQAFAAYQSAQEDRAKWFVFVGNMLLDKITWRTWFSWFSFRFVDPWIRSWLGKKLMLPFLARGPRLDFVPFEDECSGKTPWTYGKEVGPPKSWLQALGGAVHSVLGFTRKEKST
jgi:hypothetical protein